MLSYPLAHASDLGVLGDCEDLSVNFEDLFLHGAHFEESVFVWEQLNLISGDESH